MWGSCTLLARTGRISVGAKCVGYALKLGTLARQSPRFRRDLGSVPPVWVLAVGKMRVKIFGLCQMAEKIWRRIQDACAVCACASRIIAPSSPPTAIAEKPRLWRVGGARKPAPANSQPLQAPTRQAKAPGLTPDMRAKRNRGSGPVPYSAAFVGNCATRINCPRTPVHLPGLSRRNPGLPAAAGAIARDSYRFGTDHWRNCSPTEQ